MDNRLSKGIMAGLIGTGVMTMITMLAPMMGLPKMSPPAMLAGMLGMPLAVGWVMHFMIGVMFALAYTFLFAPAVGITNQWVKGAIFGLAVFGFAQVMMAVMGMMRPMPPMEGAMLPMMMGSLFGHLAYGMTVAKAASPITSPARVTG